MANDTTSQQREELFLQFIIFYLAQDMKQLKKCGHPSAKPDFKDNHLNILLSTLLNQMPKQII